MKTRALEYADDKYQVALHVLEEGEEPQQAGHEAEERCAPPQPQAPAEASDDALERVLAGGDLGPRAQALEVGRADGRQDPVHAAGQDLVREHLGEVVRGDARKRNDLLSAWNWWKGSDQADKHVHEEEAVEARISIAQGRCRTGHSQSQSVWKRPHFIGQREYHETQPLMHY